MLEAPLDGLTAGVYLTARDGRMVYMNAAAERQVKTGGTLRLVNKRIHAVNANIRTALTRAIDEVASNDMAAHPGGHSLAIPDAEGSGYVATLLPIERGGRRSIMAPFEASVAVFMQDPADVPLMPGEAFVGSMV